MMNLKILKKIHFIIFIIIVFTILKYKSKIKIEIILKQLIKKIYLKNKSFFLINLKQKINNYI
jgi:hypothetical protein